MTSLQLCPGQRHVRTAGPQKKQNQSSLFFIFHPIIPDIIVNGLNFQAPLNCIVVINYQETEVHSSKSQVSTCFLY